MASKTMRKLKLYVRPFFRFIDFTVKIKYMVPFHFNFLLIWKPEHFHNYINVSNVTINENITGIVTRSWFKFLMIVIGQIRKYYFHGLDFSKNSSKIYHILSPKNMATFWWMFPCYYRNYRFIYIFVK